MMPPGLNELNKHTIWFFLVLVGLDFKFFVAP